MTKDMIKEAVTCGFYHSNQWGRDYPKLQVLTIGELLSGKKPDIPYSPAAFKQAQKYVKPEDEHYNEELFK